MKIRLRFLFVALLLLCSVSVGFSYQRAVLLEEFMSSTCPPCAAASVWLDPFFAAQGTLKFPVVMYHMNWPTPYNDPWYQADSVELLKRRLYYACNAIPLHLIDGVDAGFTQAAVQNAFVSRRLVPSHIWLSTSAVRSTNDSINVTVKAVADSAITGMRLRVCLVEKHEYWPTAAPNGMTDFEYPFIKFAPDTLGFLFTHSGNTSDTLTFTCRFAPRTTGPEPYTISNCGIVAFVQNHTTKEVMQSSYWHMITSPIASDLIYAGYTIPISWTPFVTDTAGVNILINRSYPGTRWDTIAINVPNNGTYPWTVTGPLTTHARIKVVSRGTVWNGDTSIADLNIRAHVAVTLTPNPLIVSVNPRDTLTQAVNVHNTDTSAYYGSATAVLGTNNFTFLQTADPGGPTAQWIDISSTGTAIPSGSDTISDPITLPFDYFMFYTGAYTQVYMSTNGWISFNDFQPTSGTPGRFPNQLHGSMIAPYWEHLTVPEGGARYLLDAAGQRAIFSWQGVHLYGTTLTTIDAQVVLYADGTYQFNYRNIVAANAHAYIGVQSEERQSFVNVSSGLPGIANNSAHFRFEPIWGYWNTTQFTIPAGQSVNVPLLFDANYALPGTYHGTVSFTGNIDPVTLPVTFTIASSAAPEPVALPGQYSLESVYPNPFNPTTVVKFRLANSASVSLKLFDVTGRLVRTEIFGKMGAGEHSYTIHGDNLATGTYFVKFTAGGNYSAVKKLVLLK